MESIKILVFFIFFSAYAATPSSKLVGVFYYKNIFGSLHQGPSQYSSVLTTISCGHPVKVYESSDKTKEKWANVKVGAYTGYVLKDFLATKKVECFQDKYPRFFENLQMDLADYYYWGRLYDQYIQGKSKVR